jgi:hypothetical protein
MRQTLSRGMLMAVIAASAAFLTLTPEPASAGTSESSGICTSLGCGGGSRGCASLTLPAEECEEGVMCCPYEPTYLNCYEKGGVI